MPDGVSVWIAFLSLTILGVVVFVVSALRPARTQVVAPDSHSGPETGDPAGTVDGGAVLRVVAGMQQRIEALESDVEDLSRQLTTLAEDHEYLASLVEGRDDATGPPRRPPQRP